MDFFFIHPTAAPSLNPNFNNFSFSRLTQLNPDGIHFPFS